MLANYMDDKDFDLLKISSNFSCVIETYKNWTKYCYVIPLLYAKNNKIIYFPFSE